MAEYLSVVEAARRLGIKRETVRTLIEDGTLRGHKKTLRRTSAFMIELASVEAFDAQRRVQSEPRVA